jgi:hypothetical protein
MALTTGRVVGSARISGRFVLRTPNRVRGQSTQKQGVTNRRRMIEKGGAEGFLRLASVVRHVSQFTELLSQLAETKLFP